MKVMLRASLLATCAFFAAPAAFAQAVAPSSASPRAGLDETKSAPASDGTADIIVTAQRRSESLARTPVAVSVVSADKLEKAAIVTQSDLQIAVPGLLVRAQASSNNLNYAIRGQSVDAYSYGRPGVLPYFNDVQISGPGISSAFYDLQSVQVLKGPQGTLFGRNATGGAVLFTSQKPTPDFGGYVSAAGGNYGTVRLEGALNVPVVTDKLLARIAGFYSKTNGFQRDLYYNRRLGDSERYGFRGSLTANLGIVKNDLVVDYYHATGTNMIGVLSSLSSGAFPGASLYSNATFPAGSGPLTGTSVSDYIFDQILQAGGVPAATAAAISTGNYARFITGLNNPNAPIGGLAQILADQNARGPYVTASNAANNFHTANVIVTNVTSVDIAAQTQIKNIFGYANIKGFTNVDADGTAFQVADSGSNPDKGAISNNAQVSDEIQIIGKTIGENLSYVAGGYYSKEKSTVLQNSQFFDVIGGAMQQNQSRTDNTTFAGYTQGTYDLSSATGLAGLGATAGVRYTSEKVRIRVLPGDSAYSLALANPGIYSDDQSTTYNKVSWTLGLKEQLNPFLLLYAASRRSYKNGGYNGAVPPKIGDGDVAGNAYKAETVTDAELGAKYQGELDHMPTRFNLALYHDWITNSQRTAFASVAGSPAAITVNVPKSRVYGVEVDGQISPVTWLALGGSTNYTHARFTDTQTAVGGIFQSFETYPDTPEWSGSIFADVTIPLQADISATLHGDAFGQTKTFFSSTQNLNPGAFNTGYVLTNFRVGVQDTRAGWSLTANLKNAFNRVYYVGGLAFGQLLEVNTRVPGDPRTILVEARVKF